MWMQPHAATYATYSLLCGLIKHGKCQLACCHLLRSISPTLANSLCSGISIPISYNLLYVHFNLLSQYFHCIRFGDNDTINTFIFMLFFCTQCMRCMWRWIGSTRLDSTVCQAKQAWVGARDQENGKYRNRVGLCVRARMENGVNFH